MSKQVETSSSPSTDDAKGSSRAHEIVSEVESFAPAEAAADPSTKTVPEAPTQGAPDAPAGDSDDLDQEESDTIVNTLANHLVGWPPPLAPRRSRREEAEAFFAFSRRLAEETRVSDLTEDFDETPRQGATTAAGEMSAPDQRETLNERKKRNERAESAAAKKDK